MLDCEVNNILVSCFSRACDRTSGKIFCWSLFDQYSTIASPVSFESITSALSVKHYFGIEEMACVPFGMHAAQKVRQNMNLTEAQKAHQEGKKSAADWSANFNHQKSSAGEPIAKYSDKMMNSIWGLYNRYSVHNFKSSTSGVQAVGAAAQQPEWLLQPISSSWAEMQALINSKGHPQ